MNGTTSEREFEATFYCRTVTQTSAIIQKEIVEIARPQHVPVILHRRFGAIFRLFAFETGPERGAKLNTELQRKFKKHSVEP